MRSDRAGVRVPRLHARASGVLLHLTSLPGPHGSGDLGVEARRFADFLAAAGQSWWQMLPVGPAGFGNSPYSSHSAFAGNPLLISLQALHEEGLLDRPALVPGQPFPEERVDYGAVAAYREGALASAFAAFRKRRAGPDTLAAFCARNAAWLDDYALYTAIKRTRGGVQWTLWEPELRARKPEALARARAALADEIEQLRFEQWIFERQWTALRAHCAERGVALLGDVPIFVAHDSADVWAHPELFFLDAKGMPTVVAGVPPDYFSRTGQRWGNPLYRWARSRREGHRFWIARLAKALERFDALRLDHFIGFSRYWEIPAACPTAQEGRWRRGPGAELFETVRRALGTLPLVAEDLGLVTPEVRALRDRFELPGLRILQFAFGSDPSGPEFKPHNYVPRSVVYTGTHDNDTVVGWFREEGGEGGPRSRRQAEKEREYCLRYLGSDGREIHWDFIRAALASVAGLAIVPAQDLLGLGNEARMNRPGHATGNWEWRLLPGQLDRALGERLGGLARLYDRVPAPEPADARDGPGEAAGRSLQ